jgi:hypothetical protein
MGSVKIAFTVFVLVTLACVASGLNVGDTCTGTGRHYRRECEPEGGRTDKCAIYFCNVQVTPPVCASRPASPSVGLPCGRSNIGICKMGTLQCDPETGALGCDGAVMPLDAEIVGNSLDDNCDGTVE